MQILNPRSPASYHIRRRIRLTKLLSTGLLAVTAGLACSAEEKEVVAPVMTEGPDDEILRVGTVWESRSESRVIKSKPSPYAFIRQTIVSTIELKAGEAMATETIEIEEQFRLRAGSEVICHARSKGKVALGYGRRSGGEAAVQIGRSETQVARQCEPAGVLEDVLVIPGIVGRFQLKGDRLDGFEPALEKRTFIPIE